MGNLLHVICDYAPGDLAFAEIEDAIRDEIPTGWSVNRSSIGNFDTVGCGFVIGQLALKPRNINAGRRLIFANCAPRKDRSTKRTDNEGEELLYAQTKTGCELLVVNSGYSLSFVRDSLEVVKALNIKKGGSQFRSRDIFPPAIGFVTRGEYDRVVTEALNPAKVIPPPPNHVVGYIDNFGNLKTTIRSTDGLVQNLKPGARVLVTINERTLSAWVAKGSFNVSEGDIAFAPGSSGYEDRFWELFQRGGNAWATWGKPGPGSAIKIVSG
jgi:hypothetical protein